MRYRDRIEGVSIGIINYSEEPEGVQRAHTSLGKVPT